MSHLNRSTCEDAFRRLDDFLDRRLSPDETRLIEEHLHICAACTREFNFEASVLNGVRQKLRHLSAPADLESCSSARRARTRGATSSSAISRTSRPPKQRGPTAGSTPATSSSAAPRATCTSSTGART